MDKLVAISPILFEAHLYKIGEELPASNHEMVKLWLDNGMAQWEKETKEKVYLNSQTFGETNENIENDSEKTEFQSDDNTDEEQYNTENQNEESKSSSEINKSNKPIGRRNK